MLIKPDELILDKADLLRAFKSLNPDCGTNSWFKIGANGRQLTVKYKTKINSIAYAGITADVLFCTDYSKEDWKPNQVLLHGSGTGIYFILPHILRDILKVCDGKIVLHQSRGKVILMSDGCTWTLDSIPLDDYPTALLPDHIEVKPVIESAPIIKAEVKPDPVKAITDAYAKAITNVKPKVKPVKVANFANSTVHTVDDVFKAAGQCKELPHVRVEICGSWLWVTGDTKPHKELLVKLGMKWSGSKKAWYMNPGDTVRGRGKRPDLNYIRQHHGDNVIKDDVK